jgi:hypothetical protein
MSLSRVEASQLLNRAKDLCKHSVKQRPESASLRLLPQSEDYSGRSTG